MTQTVHCLLNIKHNFLNLQHVSRPLYCIAPTQFSRFIKSLVLLLFQNKMYMDTLYGWEVTLLEPNNFWDIIPDEISQSYHFYNIPISSNVTHKNNPLRIIRDIATVDDFVSFKLDVDTPYVEIPLALQIANDPSMAALIDEFFIEIHFDCPLLRGCWGTVPKSIDGFTLDRVSAMKILQKFRTMGIRSHFWP